MTRLAFVAAGAALLVLLGIGTAQLLAPAPAPTDAQRVERLAAELRCPDCQALSVAESRTRAAADIREQIAAQVAAGRGDAEIRRHFVDRYGEWILLAPSDALAWWLPPLVVLAAIAAFAAWLVRWRTGASRRAQGQPAGDDEHRHIGEELEAPDG